LRTWQQEPAALLVGVLIGNGMEIMTKSKIKNPK